MFRRNYSMRGQPSYMGGGLMKSNLKQKLKKEVEMDLLDTTIPTMHYNKPNIRPILPDSKSRNFSNLPPDHTNLLNNSVPLHTVLTDISFKRKKKNYSQEASGVKLNIH